MRLETWNLLLLAAGMVLCAAWAVLLKWKLHRAVTRIQSLESELPALRQEYGKLKELSTGAEVRAASAESRARVAEKRWSRAQVILRKVVSEVGV